MQAAMLRAVAERLELTPVRELIKDPILCDVYRITVYYHDRRALDAVGTVRHLRSAGTELALVYRGAFQNKPLLHPVSDSRYQGFVRALQHLRFDHLGDQPDMALFGLDFWMIERASGGFYKSVILAPETATGDHGQLVEIVRSYLPETLRLLPQG